ncbi:hypothetical protein ACQJBY_046525 [Aegilops geniculata]
MEDKRKAVANNEERRQRQRRERDAAAVADTATSGRTTATAGGNGTAQELPRVTAATTPALGPPPGASSQFVDNGRPQHAQIGNAGAPQGHGNTVIDQQRLRDQPSSSRARAPGCTCCGGAPITRVVLNLPICEACYRRDFHIGAPQQHAQIGYAGAPRGAVRNPVAVPIRAPPRPFSMLPFRWGPANPPIRAPPRPSSSPAPNGPPQHAQIGPPPLHTLAPPPERQSSSRAREQQLQVQADAMRLQLQVANILNNPFSLVRSGPANPAPQRQSSSPGPGCYSNIFTGNGPLFSSAGARAPQGQGHGTAIDQQRQLDLLRGQRQPSSSQARAPGCSSCGARATRVALKMPFCEACFRDTFMANAPPQHARIGSKLPRPVPSYNYAQTGTAPPPQHAQIGSKLPSPVPSYNYAQTGNARPQHTLAGNVSSSPVPAPSNAGAPQGQQQYRDSVVELLAATEPSPPAGSQRAAYSRCEACRLSGDKACMFCHNPGPPPPPPGQS